MIALRSRHWWMFLLRGLVAVLFGLVTFLWPLLTLSVLAFWFSAFIFVDSLFILIFALRSIIMRFHLRQYQCKLRRGRIAIEARG